MSSRDRETVRALGRPAVVEQCDLACAEDAERAVERAIERLGRVDVCVCSAGTAIRESPLDVTLEDFRRIVELTSCRPLPSHVQRRGR